jgi:hypothetical protein
MPNIRTLLGGALLAPALVLAQRPTRSSSRTPVAPVQTHPASMLDSARFNPTAPELRGLRWRLVGPQRGGRVAAVTGDPTDPLTFYFGGVDGGVWKTVNGGASWANVSDGKSTIASVGAIAVAPSDHNEENVGGG